MYDLRMMEIWVEKMNIMMGKEMSSKPDLTNKGNKPNMGYWSNLFTWCLVGTKSLCVSLLLESLT